MAKRRRKRKSSRTSNVRSKKVREGKKILSTEHDDRIAAEALSGLFNEHNDVLDATDLNESFKYFELQQKKKR